MYPARDTHVSVSVAASLNTQKRPERTELTGLGGEVAVDRVAGLLVGEVRHGLKRRRT